MICQLDVGFHHNHAWIEIPRCHLSHSLKENCPSWRFQLLITSAQITSNWWMKSIVKLRGEMSLFSSMNLNLLECYSTFNDPIHIWKSDHIIQSCVGSLYSFHMKRKLVWLVVICRVFCNRVVSKFLTWLKPNFFCRTKTQLDR